jgi:hypothetical protein
VSFAAITLSLASQRVFVVVVVVVVYFVMTQSGNFWIHPRRFVHLLRWWLYKSDMDFDAPAFVRPKSSRTLGSARHPRIFQIATV